MPADSVVMPTPSVPLIFESSTYDKMGFIMKALPGHLPWNSKRGYAKIPKGYVAVRSVYLGSVEEVHVAVNEREYELMLPNHVDRRPRTWIVVKWSQLVTTFPQIARYDVR